MEIKVNFLDKLRLEAKFDDFTVIADQPIRYKGDGSAPGPFDYFLASSALCAAYFVKLYCSTRNIPTENIRLSQNNIVDPENRYQQIFKIQVELPPDISAKDREGILRSIDRCTVKKVVQAGPEFIIEEVENLDADAQALLTIDAASGTSTYIPGKDLPLEQTIANMSGCWLTSASRLKSHPGAISFPMSGRCTSATRTRQCASPMAKARPRRVHWRLHWASTSSESAATISTPANSGAKILPTPTSCIIRMSAGSSRAAKTRCRPRSWTNTAAEFTTRMANCVAPICTTPIPATSNAASAPCRS
jgi:uncharacterized OsmC-like protein